MKVYFGCSTRSADDHADAYRAIRQQIVSSGHTLTRDWLEKSLATNKSETMTNDRSNYYDEVMDAIIHADVVIFDCTVPSMGIGHQITYAIDRGKPTLMLVNENQENTKKMFISGASAPFFRAVNYKDALDVAEKVSSFLAEESPQSKIRFNLVIDRAQNNYLDWAAYKYKMTKTRLIKKAIALQIDADGNYTGGADISPQPSSSD